MRNRLMWWGRRVGVVTVVALAAACGSGTTGGSGAAESTGAGDPSTTTGASADESRPGPAMGDHWHVAYGIHVCGEWLGPLSDSPGAVATGIHTHDDGLIHVHPFTSEVSGVGADLGAFADTVGMELAPGSLTLPDGRSFADGDRCDGSSGRLRVLVWDGPDDAEPEEVRTGLSDIGFTDGATLAVVFAGDDRDDIPRPPAGGPPVEPQPADQEWPTGAEYAVAAR